MKYYAVRRGKRMGIFTSSKEFKDCIEGISDAEYRVFKTEKDAESYIARYMQSGRNR